MALLVGAGVQSVDTASAQFHAEDRALGSVIRVGCGSSSPAKVPQGSTYNRTVKSGSYCRASVRAAPAQTRELLQSPLPEQPM
jgi:hypothetical protein